MKAVNRDLSDDDIKYLFAVALHPDHLQPCSIVHRVEQLIRTSASRFDFFPILASFINGVLQQVFGEVVILQQQSLIKQMNQRGLRVFQCYLCDMVQGGSVFDSSYLVPKSKIAFSFLEAILQKDDLIDLIRQSIKKLITVAVETANGDCLSEVLNLNLWFARYSK